MKTIIIHSRRKQRQPYQDTCLKITWLKSQERLTLLAEWQTPLKKPHLPIFTQISYLANSQTLTSAKADHLFMWIQMINQQDQSVFRLKRRVQEIRLFLKWKAKINEGRVSPKKGPKCIQMGLLKKLKTFLRCPELTKTSLGRRVRFIRPL